MSPVPPPAGTYIPSDDWTEDPSFDLYPSAQHLALPSSPSSSSSTSTSTSASHSHSLSRINGRDARSPSPSRSPQQSTIRQHTSSPLKNSFTEGGKGGATLKLKKRQVEELNLDLDLDFDDDFDLPATKSLPSLMNSHSTSKANTDQRPRSSTGSSASSLISRTVVGTGPTGIGTITRLGSASGSQTNTIKGLANVNVRARAAAIEKSWEADVDFDLGLDETGNFEENTHAASGAMAVNPSHKSVKRLTLSPPSVRRGFMPPPDALDDLGFELDEDDEDQATLKAGATIKAMLPTPRNHRRTEKATVRPSSSSNMITIPPPSTPPAQDPDSLELEVDFALPLNLTNLTMATQPQPSRRHGSNSKREPRSSVASTVNTESWDSPGTALSGGKGGWGTKDSPSLSLGGSNSKRRSETSATSISDALPETPIENKFKYKNQTMSHDNDNNNGQGGVRDDHDDDEEDMELGLVLPSPTFFSNTRATELNSILDRKRKPQYAPTPTADLHQHHRLGTDESRRSGPGVGDDSFEDGLVLDEPGVELSRHRLREKKKARDRPTTGGMGTRRGLSLGGAAKTVAKEREKAWEKQREQGWGRLTSGPGANAAGASAIAGPSGIIGSNPANNNLSIRERTQSSLGLSFRSNSASAMPTLRERDSTRRADSPALTLTGRERESMRSRSGHIHSMLPPPSSVPPPLPNPQSTLHTTSSQAHPPTPSSSSRLRHQKSHYHITPQQMPANNLTRKQSLASLQDAIAQGQGHGHHGDRTLTSLDPLPHTPQQQASSSTTRYHNSTSRLTMPTSSSRAKIRPAITSIFPREFPTPSSSASSLSSLGGTGPNHPITSRNRYDQPYSNTQYHPHGGMTPGQGYGSRMMNANANAGSGAQRRKNWGDGTELDSIDDLNVDEDAGLPGREDVGTGSRHSGALGLGLGKPSRRGNDTPTSTYRSNNMSGSQLEVNTAERRMKSGSGIGAAVSNTTKRSRTRKPAGLIKHLGGAGKKKVVGEMTWNPTTLRWEGNESVLRDFDAISTPSVRPALITHFTGSSVGAGLSSPVGAGVGVGAGGGNPPSAPRVVGDMQFDPIQMRWVSILSPEDDEPDPFEGMADDEDDEFAAHGAAGGAGGTITRSSGRKLVTIGDRGGFAASMTTSGGWSSRLASESSMATSRAASMASHDYDDPDHRYDVDHASSSKFHLHQHSQNQFGSGHGQSQIQPQAVDEALWKECKQAEERHKKEMKGWIMRSPSGVVELRERERKEEKRLWEIRSLAMRS